MRAEHEMKGKLTRQPLRLAHAGAVEFSGEAGALFHPGVIATAQAEMLASALRNDGRGEVQGKARVARQPALGRRCFVGPGVVEHDMDIEDGPAPSARSG